MVRLKTCTRVASADLVDASLCPMASGLAIGPVRRSLTLSAALLVLSLDKWAVAAPLPLISQSEEERLADEAADQERGLLVCVCSAILLVMLFCTWLAAMLIYKHLEEVEDFRSVNVRESNNECILCIAESSMVLQPAGSLPWRPDVELEQPSVPVARQPPFRVDDETCDEPRQLAPVTQSSFDDCVLCELVPVGDHVMSELVPVSGGRPLPAKWPPGKNLQRAGGSKARGQ